MRRFLARVVGPVLVFSLFVLLTGCGQSEAAQRKKAGAAKGARAEAEVTELDETVRVGHTRKQVIQIMGRPAGALKTGSKETLMYDRGEIILKKGMLTPCCIR